MANVFKKTLIAGAAALTLAGGMAAVPNIANARGFGGGGHFGGGGGHFGGFGGGQGFAGRGFGGRGFGGRGFGYGVGLGALAAVGAYGTCGYGYGYGYYGGPYGACGGYGYF